MVPNNYNRNIATDMIVLFLLFRPPYSPRLIVLDNPNVVFLICDTKVRHELASSEYNIRRETCAAAADKMGKPSLRDASIHDLESMCHAYKLQMKQKSLTVENFDE